jgi:hypothetical protein
MINFPRNVNIKQKLRKKSNFDLHRSLDDIQKNVDDFVEYNFNNTSKNTWNKSNGSSGSKYYQKTMPKNDFAENFDKNRGKDRQ